MTGSLSEHVKQCGQGCSGAITQRSAVPANIFELERHSGKYCLSQPER